MAALARVEVLRGVDALDRLGPGFDELLDEVGAPITARRCWLEAWVRSQPFDPLVVAVADDGRLVAVAPLAVRRRRGVSEIVMIGHATSDRTCLPARDPAAAQALAEAVAGSSRSWRRPWRVRLEQLPLADPVAQLLAARLPGGAVVEGDACAVLDFDQGRDADTYERKSFRRNLRGGRNRLDRDGREWTIRRIDDPLAIEAALDDILALRRARDHDLGRRSDVDDLAGERRWRELVRAHASAGGAEVVELSVDGALGAYAIAFLDRGRYRLWDARIASDLRRYNLGHLVAQELLHSALVHEDIDELDLGRGAQEDKRMLASRLEERSDLVAASSAWARLILDAPGRLRWRAAQFKNRHPPLRRAWARVKQLTMSR